MEASVCCLTRRPDSAAALPGSTPRFGKALIEGKTPHDPKTWLSSISRLARSPSPPFCTFKGRVSRAGVEIKGYGEVLGLFQTKG